MNRRNRDNLTALDLVKEQDSDLADLLRGDAALLDAAKKGDLDRIKKLLTSENINCRDEEGRNSTLLHLAGKGKGGQKGVVRASLHTLTCVYILHCSWLQPPGCGGVPPREWSRCECPRQRWTHPTAQRIFIWGRLFPIVCVQSPHIDHA